MKVGFNLLIFLTGSLAAPSYAEFKNPCEEWIESEPAPRVGYVDVVRGIDPTEAHTIKDPLAFARDNLGDELMKAATGTADKFYIYMGDGKEAFHRARNEGWTLSKPLEKREGFHQVYRATRGNETAFLILRVNGEDRKAHVQSLLRLAGVAADRVMTSGRTKKWKQNYLAAFRRTGEKPDLVVYGFALTTIAAVLEKNPLANVQELLKLRSNRVSRDRVPDLAVSGDLDGVQMHRLKFRDGRVVWIFNSLYGDLSDDLLEAIVDHGASRILYIGTTGALTSKYAVGDLVVPAFVSEGGKMIASSDPWKFATRLKARSANYLRVVAPAEETLRWLHAMIAATVDVVEVELGYWLDRLKSRPDVKFTPVLVVSDVMSGPNHSDLTEWGSSNSRVAREGILQLFDYHLGMTTDRDFRVSKYEKIGLGESP